MYNDIDCQFLICELCFWTATIFNLTEKWEKDNIKIDAIELVLAFVLYVQARTFL